VSVEAIGVKMGSLHLANPTLLASRVHGSSLSKVLDALKFGAGGADFLIVGRSITESLNPSKALAEVIGV
jgi:hypothetical protein